MTATSTLVEQETPRTEEEPDRALGWGLLLGGLIGLIAAGVLLVERFHLAEDPNYVPSCSLNPVLSCGSVMATEQAAVLGFPNPIIGVAAFPVLITTGVVLLAGARLPRWYHLGLQAGVTVGFGFICWLIFQSLYRIGALCPYCMVVWAVVVPTFVYVTARNIRRGVLGDSLARGSLGRGLVEWRAIILLVVVMAVLVMITLRFWAYWSTLI